MIQNKVYLREEDHRYFDKETGKEYESCSRVISIVKHKFERDRIAHFSALKEGVSKEEILARWDKKNKDSIDHGNAIHNALELYWKTLEIKEERFRPLIMSIKKDNEEYARSYSEEVMYSDKYGVACMIDRLLQVTNSSKSVIDIEDYKTNQSKGIQYHGHNNQRLLEPLSWLQDCNYVHYSLQLSINAILFEEVTGKKVRSLWIRFIPPNNFLAHVRIPVMYMRMEAIALLEYYKSKKNETIPETSLDTI